MLGLFYPYRFILQAVAILHFVRRRPDTYWLFIILIGGALGAFVYTSCRSFPTRPCSAAPIRSSRVESGSGNWKPPSWTIPRSATMKSSDT